VKSSRNWCSLSAPRLPLSSAHLPDPSFEILLQRFDDANATRRSLPRGATPVTRPPHCWIRLRISTTHSSSPRSSEHRPHVRSPGEPPEQCHRPPPSRDLVGDDETLASTGEPLPLRSHPLDLDVTILIESLTEPVWDDLIRPDLLKFDGLKSRSARTGISEPQCATCRSVNQTEIKLEFSNQN
jgi:hypothetical protein